jgi:hypothetical protein
MEKEHTGDQIYVEEWKGGQYFSSKVILFLVIQITQIARKGRVVHFFNPFSFVIGLIGRCGH